MESGDETRGIRYSGADLRERRRGVGATESQSSKLTRRRIRACGNADLTCEVSGVCGEQNDSAFASSASSRSFRRRSRTAYVSELGVAVRRYFGRDISTRLRSAHKE